MLSGREYTLLQFALCHLCSHAYAFYAAALLTGDVSKYHALIEDMVAQADEIDDVIMRFEGGLIPTASVIDASYKLAVTAKKSPTIAEVIFRCETICFSSQTCLSFVFGKTKCVSTKLTLLSGASGEVRQLHAEPKARAEPGERCRAAASRQDAHR